jgi:EAL domain-containing protein (putative c-di-GMP-specific phosphodiesterase class I)
VLKIDRTFTHGIPENGDNLALVRTIIALASGLGLTVIAEGVETRVQHDTLIAEGCLLGQGYLYGKPSPALQVEALLFSRDVVNPDAELIG